MQSWINMVEVNCEPEREAELHHWYDTVHVPARLGKPETTAIRRYQAHEPRDGRGKFLALYNLKASDPSSLQPDENAVPGPDGSTALFTPIWKNVFCRQLFEQVADAYRSTGLPRWINVVELYCAPRREAEFHDWYNTEHLPDAMKTPGFGGARRYEMRNLLDGRGKYVTVYYIETENIEETMRNRIAYREREHKAGRSSAARNITRTLWRDVLWKEISQAARNPDRAASNSPFSD